MRRKATQFTAINFKITYKTDSREVFLNSSQYIYLRLCARVSHCASFAYAQDLGRFLKRLVNLAPNVSGATIPD